MAVGKELGKENGWWSSQQQNIKESQLLWDNCCVWSGIWLADTSPWQALGHLSTGLAFNR